MSSDLADLSLTQMDSLSHKPASGRHRHKTGSSLLVHFAIVYSVCTFLGTA